MTDIGEVVVKVRADSTQMKQEMKSLSSTVKEHTDLIAEALERTKRVLENLGIAIAAREVVEFAKSALETADNIYIMAQRIGFAGETLSALNVPLKQNGSNIDEFANSMKFMSRNIELAAQGNQALIKDFDSLGLSVTKLKSLSPEEQFKEIALALGQMDDQGKLTATTLAIMGRGAAGLIPALKESKGNIQEIIDKQKELGNVLSNEELERIHRADDAWVSFWEHMKVKTVEATLALKDFADARRTLAPENTLSGIGAATGTSVRPKSVDHATFLNQTNEYGDDFPDLFPGSVEAKNAKGGNTDILKADTTAADRAKALRDYIQNLKDEATALSFGKEKLAEYRNEKAAAAAGGKQIADLTEDEKNQIDAATLAFERQKDALAELQKEEQKHIQMVAQMEAQISSSLADIALNYKSLGSSVSAVLNQIAKQLIEMNITTPLVQAVGGTKGSPGLLSGFTKMLGFADGGSPPVGVPSMVGENGPEIFIPNSAGTVIPNGKIGGGSVSVYQSFNLNPGATEQTVAQLRNLVPAIAAQAHASVFQAIQNGGDASRLVGRRS